MPPNIVNIQDIMGLNKKNFKFKPQVAMLLRKKGPLPEDIIKAARTIHAGYRRPDKVEALKTFLTLAVAIDEVKQETTGFNAPTIVSNVLISYLAACFANELEPDKEFIRKISDFEKQLALGINPKYKLGYIESGWLIPKTQIFKSACQMQMEAVELVRQMAIQAPSLAIEGLFNSFSNPAQVNAQIFSEMLSMRKYGVKTVVFRDGLLNMAGFDWLFSDKNFMFRELESQAASFSVLAYRDVEACVSLVKRGLKPSELFKGGSHTYSGRAGLEYVSMEGMASLFIGKDGEISLSTGPGVSPLRNVFAAQGHEQLYEYFRFVQLMRLFDLVVPVTQVAKMPKLPSEPSKLGKILQASGVSKKPRDYIDILLPRVRLLENHQPELASDLVEEVEKSEANTHARSRTQQAQHKVVGFVRPLPEGYKASKRARELAWEEQKIILGENETYVKTHKRGKGPAKDVFHKARK